MSLGVHRACHRICATAPFSALLAPLAGGEGAAAHALHLLLAVSTVMGTSLSSVQNRLTWSRSWSCPSSRSRNTLAPSTAHRSSGVATSGVAFAAPKRDAGYAPPHLFSRPPSVVTGREGAAARDLFLFAPRQPCHSWLVTVVGLHRVCAVLRPHTSNGIRCVVIRGSVSVAASSRCQPPTPVRARPVRGRSMSSSASSSIPFFPPHF